MADFAQNQRAAGQALLTLNEGLRFYHEFGTDKIPKKRAYRPWYRNFPAGPVDFQGKQPPDKLARWEGCEEKLWQRFCMLQACAYPANGEPLLIFDEDVAIRHAGALATEDPLSSRRGYRFHQEKLVEGPVQEMLFRVAQQASIVAEELNFAYGVSFGWDLQFGADRARLGTSRICFGGVDKYSEEGFLIHHQGVHLLSVDDFQKVLDQSPDLFQKVQSGFWTAEEEAVAKTLVELYDRMWRTNHRYACLTTVEALVFVQLRPVRRHDGPGYATEMLCHVAEPRRDVSVSGHLFYSTVAQMASFCLFTL